MKRIVVVISVMILLLTGAHAFAEEKIAFINMKDNKK